MAFKIINANNEPPLWCGTDGSSVYYVGQIVTIIGASKAQVAGGGVKPLAVPAGEADTTNFQIPYGVVVGFNNRLNPTFDTTGEKATGVATQAAQLARDWAFGEGPFVKGDPQVLLRIERIYPHSVLRGNVYNSTLGTAPTVVTASAGDTTGWTSAGTTTACDFTPVGNLCTAFCRTGANAGMFRKTTDTSTTAPAVTIGFPYDVASGDTFVRVPFAKGFSKIYIAGPGLFVDCSASPATNTFHVFVHNHNLDIAGKETVDFSFSLDHFCFARA